MTRPSDIRRRSTRAALAAGAAVAALAMLTACGNSGTSSTGSPSQPAVGSSAASAVLPVENNPIRNTSTTKALTIDSILVENNVDKSGKATDDHLEIKVTNTGDAALASFEVYYTITDPKTSDDESYYTKLPASFTVAAGVSRVIHFDNTGATDHYPVNQFSLYYTDANALDVAVEVSAVDSAPQTATVAKDAGGAEEAD